MNSIPASELVNIVPSVLGAGGNPLSLNSVFLSPNNALPIDASLGYVVMAFPTLAAVKAFFGQTSPEADAAAIYFAGFTGATALPGNLYFVRYNTAAVPAYLRGGALALTLAQLQALSGTLIVSIDGRVYTSANIDLSTATSFSNAASLVQTGLNTTGNVFAGTASQAGTTLTVTAVTSGALHVDDAVVGANISGTVVAQLSGTPGGVGTYQLSSTATQSAEAVTVTATAAVSWDSQRSAFVITSPTTGAASTLDSYATGTLAASLRLASGTSAVLSQGAAIATPTAVLDDVVNQTQNWVFFMSIAAMTTDENVAFAAWANASNQRYGFVGWEETAEPTEGPAPTSFGALTASNEGRVALWSPVDKAAFICATTASINFAETNGRITYAYKSQAGLAPDVVDATVAANLLANGYNFYGAYATANDQFQFLQNGQISGTWKWIDSFVNQVKLTSDLQLSILYGLSRTKSVPYVTRGYDLIRSWVLDPINRFINFGGIVAGVTLSASQRAQITAATNNPTVADVLQSRGWYLEILDADPTVRANRGSPPMRLWYMDGGSIQKINLAAINVQ